MATIKRGDKVGIGPAHVTWMSDENPNDCDPTLTLKHYGVNANQGELFPWHPALPKLAALLASDGPALAAAMSRMQLHIENDMNQWPSPYRTTEEWTNDAALIAQLAAALTEGTDGK